MAGKPTAEGRSAGLNVEGTDEAVVGGVELESALGDEGAGEDTDLDPREGSNEGSSGGGGA